MSQKLHYLTDDPLWFPHPKNALTEPSGLLAIGGDLSATRLLNAYQQGIFPWFNEDEPLLWWSPDPRAIIDIDGIRINKSLSKFLKKCQFKVSINLAFERVITECAKPRGIDQGTWILPEMISAYLELNKNQHAHSIEIWQDEELVGGLYGVLIGSCFCGESMFSRQPNASKLALITLGELLKNESEAFIDCQLPNPYLSSMGAYLVARDLYLEKLQKSKTSEMKNALFSPRFIEWQSN